MPGREEAPRAGCAGDTHPPPPGLCPFWSGGWWEGSPGLSPGPVPSCLGSKLGDPCGRQWRVKLGELGPEDPTHTVRAGLSGNSKQLASLQEEEECSGCSAPWETACLWEKWSWQGLRATYQDTWSKEAADAQTAGNPSPGASGWVRCGEPISSSQGRRAAATLASYSLSCCYYLGQQYKGLSLIFILFLLGPPSHMKV